MFNLEKTPPTQDSTPTPIQPQAAPIPPVTPVSASGKFFSPLQVTLIIVGALFVIGSLIIALSFNGSSRLSKIGNINQGQLDQKKEGVTSKRDAAKQAIKDRVDAKQQGQGAQINPINFDEESVAPPKNPQQNEAKYKEDEYGDDVIELKLGFIRTAYTKDGKNFVQIDFVRLCTESINYCTANGMIIDEGKYLTTIELSSDAKIYGVDLESPEENDTLTRELTFDEFKENINYSVLVVPSKIWVNKTADTYTIDKIQTTSGMLKGARQEATN